MQNAFAAVVIAKCNLDCSNVLLTLRVRLEKFL